MGVCRLLAQYENLRRQFLQGDSVADESASSDGARISFGQMNHVESKARRFRHGHDFIHIQHFQMDIHLRVASLMQLRPI